MSVLADYDEDFEETAAAEEPFGEFLWEIKDGQIQGDEPDSKTGPIVLLKLECVSDGPANGFKDERKYWLTKKADDGAGRVKNDRTVKQLNDELKKLGFDPAGWTRAAGCPWSQVLPLAVKALVGVRFKGKRSKNGEFTNLYLNARDKSDGQPEAFTLEAIRQRAKGYDEQNRDPFGDPLPE